MTLKTDFMQVGLNLPWMILHNISHRGTPMVRLYRQYLGCIDLYKLCKVKLKITLDDYAQDCIRLPHYQLNKHETLKIRICLL